MLVISYDPATGMRAVSTLRVSVSYFSGWSKPLIKPYGPLVLDPASSVFQYCPVAFEGMKVHTRLSLLIPSDFSKAYMDPQGRPRLFRPELNMERLARSADRAALPTFSPPSDLLPLIKRLVSLDSKWIPKRRGV